MSEKTEIVYFIEHVARELDIACAIKAILEEEQGLSVKVASITHDLDHTIASENPTVVLLPQCNGVIRRPPEKMLPHWPNAKYINLAFEQVLGKAQLNYMSQKDEFTRRYVLHTVWGGFYRQILIKDGVQAENVHVNGSPTQSLYLEPYYHFYPQLKNEIGPKYGLSPDKPWVFIPENYAWAFYPDKLIQDRIRRGFDPEHAYQYRDFARQSLKLSAEMWCNPDGAAGYELIVRPRPATSEHDFRAKLDEFGLSIPQQMHIIKEGSVREWIMVSDVVISSYSTTLLEAAMFRKPIYMQTPIPLPDFLYSGWYGHVEKIVTKKDFEAICTGGFDPENWQDAANWIDELYIQGDAIRNIAKLIQDVRDGSIKIDAPIPVAKAIQAPTLENLTRRTRKWLWTLYQAGLKVIPISTTEQSRQAHEKDHISQDVVNQKVNKWIEVLGL